MKITKENMMPIEIGVFPQVWCVRVECSYCGTDVELWDLTIESLSYPILVPNELMVNVDPNGEFVDVTLLELNEQIAILAVNA